MVNWCLYFVYAVVEATLAVHWFFPKPEHWLGWLRLDRPMVVTSDIHKATPAFHHISHGLSKLQALQIAKTKCSKCFFFQDFINQIIWKIKQCSRKIYKFLQYLFNFISTVRICHFIIIWYWFMKYVCDKKYWYWQCLTWNKIKSINLTYCWHTVITARGGFEIYREITMKKLNFKSIESKTVFIWKTCKILYFSNKPKSWLKNKVQCI